MFSFINFDDEGYWHQIYVNVYTCTQTKNHVEFVLNGVGVEGGMNKYQLSNYGKIEEWRHRSIIIIRSLAER